MRRSAFRRLLKRSEAAQYVYMSVRGRGERGVPRSLGVSGLLSALHSRNVNYVVLRWFDSLPHVDAGQDIDLLVSDEDAPQLEELLTRSPLLSSMPCDVYSVHGLPTFAHKGLAYYPPELAERILTRAVHRPNGARVPCKEDHFYSLAYHAIYKKGYASGLAVSSSEGPRNASPKHAYGSVLRDLASELALDVPITMHDLDHHLNEAGWRPALDTLEKWADGNPFCAELHGRLLYSEVVPTGLVVLVVRARAGHPQSVETIARLARAQGLIEVATEELRAAQVEIASRQVRGGNWGRGPYPTSGGPPHTILAYVDPTPLPPSADQLARHAGLDNARIRALKKVVRTWWNQDQPETERCNVLHTSDSSAHAVHYLYTMVPESADEIIERAAEHAPRPSA